MSVMDTLVSRRTYRRFAQKAVPQDVVDDIVEAVRLSSCGANRQAVRLVVVNKPEAVAKVQPLVKWAAYLPPEQGTPKSRRAAHPVCGPWCRTLPSPATLPPIPASPLPT